MERVDTGGINEKGDTSRMLITRSVRINLAYTSPGHGHETRVQLFLKESYILSGSTFIFGSVDLLKHRNQLETLIIGRQKRKR